MEYTFITNLPQEEVKKIYIAIQAVNIKNYTFCKNAVDVFGNPLPSYYALYFDVNTTEQEIELFWKAVLMIHERTQEETRE